MNNSKPIKQGIVNLLYGFVLFAIAVTILELLHLTLLRMLMPLALGVFVIGQIIYTFKQVVGKDRFDVLIQALKTGSKYAIIGIVVAFLVGLAFGFFLRV